MAHQGGDVDWIASIDSTIVRVHQHGATLPRDTGATKTHLVADGKGRALAFVLTGGQVVDTTMLPDTLDEIRVAGATGRRMAPAARGPPRKAPQRERPGLLPGGRRRLPHPGVKGGSRTGRSPVDRAEPAASII